MLLLLLEGEQFSPKRMKKDEDFMYLKDLGAQSDSDLIEANINESKLNNFLQDGIKKGIISGEQWFREPRRWYEMPAYINPYKTPYTELPILTRNSIPLRKRICKTLKIFYGVGVGDTELIPVQWDLASDGYAEVYVIEVIRTFIEGFMQSLRNLLEDHRSAKIMFAGNNTLFESVHEQDACPKNKGFESATLICLGNTIGNFGQDEIFEIFKRNTRAGDLLLLGFQLNVNSEALLMQYKENRRFEDLIRDSLHHGSLSIRNEWFDKFRKKEKLDWRYNKENNFVEAWSNGVLVFRSKKYDIDELAAFAKKYGFVIQNKFTLGDCGVSLFVKE